MTERSEVLIQRSRAVMPQDLATWVGEHLEVTLVDPPGTDRVELADPTLKDLAGLAVRRNPKRAHLVVSKVLGKHIPVDPRLVYAAARLLGDKAAAVLGGCVSERGWGRREAWGSFVAALRGDREELATCTGPADPGAVVPVPPLVFGFAETATALGHAVSDSFAGARYLHSTRRAVPGLTPVGTFDESHSHATEHLLLPADPAWLSDPAPVVLVDDELTTGRTAAATIRALHRLQPRDHYVVAALLDLRTEADLPVLTDLAAELGTMIDVVSLARGEVGLPPDVLTRGTDLVTRLHSSAIMEDQGPDPDPDLPRSRKISAEWPADIPEGGRHGFAPEHRAPLGAAVDTLAAEVARSLPDGRILVLGSEELMYTPLRLALALTAYRERVAYTSTTRSPVLPVDDPGYAVRTSLRFASPEPDPDGKPRFVNNVDGAGFDAIVLVIDKPADTPELWGPGGLVEALRPVTGALTVVVL
jgi:hypothetical protein